MNRLRLLLLLALVASCHRPIDGRTPGAVVLSDVQVTPAYAREGVPLDISFQIQGQVPGLVTITIGTQKLDCTPMVMGDDRFHCTHPGLNRDLYSEGAALVVLEATDDAHHMSTATGQLTIDFTCPNIISLTLAPPVGAPGTRVVVGIEASENLREAPVLTRQSRPWEAAIGAGRSYTLSHLVSETDPAGAADVVVAAVDLAGNRSSDCAADGRASFAIDVSPPMVAVDRIRVVREVSNLPSTITASAGAFLDDVGIDKVRLLDDSGLILTTIKPEADGSVRPTNLGGRPASRLRVQAVDLFGRTSTLTMVHEQWRLSVGDGSSPGTALKTAARFSPPPADSSWLEDRTIEFAPAVLAADARTAEVRAQIGFTLVGQLPPYYEDRFQIPAGYDRVQHAVVGFGGRKLGGLDLDNNPYYVEGDRTFILRWSSSDRAYAFEYGQAPAIGVTPFERSGGRLVFDEQGCGTMFGGDGVDRTDPQNPSFQSFNDVWRICSAVGGYAWQQVLTDNPGSAPIIRTSPIDYDAAGHRFMLVGGEDNAGFDNNDAYYLNVGPDLTHWHWQPITALPTNFPYRKRHLLFWDPRAQGFVVGLGEVSPTGSGEQSEIFTYWSSQWTVSMIPGALAFREGFGYDYDTARQRLVLWGDNATPQPDPDVWLMTQTATHGPSAWHNVSLDPPVNRAWQSVIYDPDREQTIAFGGVRYEDTRAVPPDIYQITLEPSWPYLQAVIDLGAARPERIEKIHLEIGGNGFGDADGVGPGTAVGEGIEVLLWDYAQRTWTPVGATVNDPRGPRVVVDLSDTPERFVSAGGAVPISIRSKNPATEKVEARLDIDLIDGYLSLKPYVP